MVIHDRGYTRWDGERDRPVRGVWVILDRGVVTGLAQIFKRKVFGQMLSFMAFGPFLFALGAMYLAFYLQANLDQFGDMAENMAREGVIEMVTPSPDTVWGFYLQVQMWVCMVLCVMVGSGLVAEDRRTNALELYLSRPLSVTQYVLGKFSVVAFFLALVTVVPVCVLILVQAVLTGFESTELLRLADLSWRALLAGGLFVGVLSLLVLTASSLSSRARNAAILWIGFVVVLEGLIADLLREEFLTSNVQLVSLHFNLGRCMAWILGNTQELAEFPDLPVSSSAAVLAGWVVVCITLVLRKVRPVEVVA
jgi:ABC-type transport system involved in multi-copper enzyme maturation permease subunit